MSRHLLIIGFLNLILLGQVYSQCDGTVFHVDQNATPGGDGLSWATAFDKLQDALAVACATDSIFVSEGTYYPDEGTGIANDAREETFQLVDGVVMLGGFSTNTGDLTLASRDWEANQTILSGDIDQTPDSTNNSFHVVSSEAVGLATILDGFTITAGNANDNNDIIDNPLEEQGGGMYNLNSSPTLRNLLFIQNFADFGAGIYNDTSNVVLIDVTLANNEANRSGGGMYDNVSNSNLLRVLISGNSAINGGGMTISFPELTPQFLIGISQLNQVRFLDNSALNTGGGLYLPGGNVANPYVAISNSVFSGNSSSGGGGISLIEASPIITGVTFTGNQASVGGAIRNFSGIPVISNSIIWNNSATFTRPSIRNDGAIPTLANSLIDTTGNSNPTAWADGEMATDLGNNLFVDPEFVSDVDNPGSSVGGNLRLLACSPAINVGTNTSLTAADTVDVEGNARIFQGTDLTVDMGAYEFQGEFGNEMDLLEVSNTNNDGCGSLRQAIINAASGDTVTFSPQIDGEPILLESQIIINKSIIIEGRDSTNTIVDGQSMDRLFEMTSGSTVVLLSMRLQNGGGNIQDGGAILNNGNLSIFQSRIVNNTATRNGGGIDNDGDLCLEESVISNNSAGNGGGIYSTNNSNTNIKKTNIFGNSASISGGGVSANDDFSMSLSIISCNEANSGVGGGIRINSNGALVMITNTAIYGNTAVDGGGIFNNVQSVTEVKSSTIAGNESSMQGGGILNNAFEGLAGELSIINSIVAINTAGTDGQDLFERTPSASLTGGITDAGFNLIGDTVGAQRIFTVSTLLGNTSNPLDPIFIENPAMPSDGICTADLRLDCASPAISGGTPDTTGLDLGDIDLQDSLRVRNILDIGAYEYQGSEMVAGLDALSALCPGESIDLSNVVTEIGGVFREEISAGLNGSIFDAGSLAAGEYPVLYIAQSVEGCQDTATITVTVFAAPDAGQDASTTLCQGKSIDLSNVVTEIGGDFVEEISAGLNGSIFDAGSLSADDYPVLYIVTSPEACQDTAIITLTVFATPDAGQDANTTICQGESIDLSNIVTEIGGDFVEEVSAGLNGSIFDAGSLAVDDYPILYILTSPEGCQDTANIIISVTNGMECLMDFTSFNIQALDPCNCENPNNIILNDRLLVADTLIGMGPANQNIQIVGASSFGFRDPQGNPIADGTLLLEDPLIDGTYRLPFYRFADEVTQVGLSLNGGSTLLFQSDSFNDCFCNIEEPVDVPVLSLWSLLLLSLFMMVSSIVLFKLIE